MCVAAVLQFSEENEEHVSEVIFTSGEDSSESQDQLGKEFPPDTEGPCTGMSICVCFCVKIKESQVKRALLMFFFFINHIHTTILYQC